MTTPATEATTEAADAAAEAAAAAAEPEATPATDTTVVVVDDGNNDDQDDATNLDHEQRITRLEERFGAVEGGMMDRPTYDDVRNMLPSPETVIETAEAAGAAAGAAAAEAVTETDETGEETSVRIEEPPPGDPVGGIVVATPEVPEATGTKKRGGIFRW